MFIRVKRVKGQEYCYLVKNSWTDKGARQKVAKYLGKLHKPERAKSKSLGEFLGVVNIEALGSKSYKDIITDLIRLELHNHNLEDKFFVSGAELKTLAGKEAAIQLNQGFLCSETIRMLAEYKAEGDEGYLLAGLITAAGLSVDKELFVMLFEKANAEHMEKSEGELQQQKAEFYY